MDSMYSPVPSEPLEALKASGGKNVHSSQARSDDTDAAAHVGGFRRCSRIPALPVVPVRRQADSAPQSEVHPAAIKAVQKASAESQATP